MSRRNLLDERASGTFVPVDSELTAMNEHPIQELHKLVFDRLEEDARRRVQAHMAACESCRHRFEHFCEVVMMESSVAPGPTLRGRLIESIDRLERFAPYAQQLGELVGFSSQDARRALHAFDDMDKWSLRPLPGMRAHPLLVGTEQSPKWAILACFDPSASVPRHRHMGYESILVFQGAFEGSDGIVTRAGGELHSSPGSAHSIVRFLDGIECLCAIINTDRLEYEENFEAEALP